MSRTNRAKDLSDRLRKLYFEDLSEQEAYNQLKDDESFSPLRLAKVNTIYKKFQAERTQTPKKKEPKKESLTVQLIKRTALLSNHTLILDCNHFKTRCLESGLTKTSNGRLSLFYQQIMTTKRAYGFSLFDSFSNKLGLVMIPRTPQATSGMTKITLNFIANDIALLVERTDYGMQRSFSKYFLTLLEFDWPSKSTYKLKTYVFEDQEHRIRKLELHVDSVNPLKFVLNRQRNDYSTWLMRAEVVNDEIVFEKDTRFENYHHCHALYSFFRDKLYSYHMCGFNRPTGSPLCVANLEGNSRVVALRVNLLPEEFVAIKGEGQNDPIGCFAMGRMYIAVEFKGKRAFGIVWMSVEERKWRPMNFCTRKPITSIEFAVDQKILLVQTLQNDTGITCGSHEIKKTVYQVPLKKPQSLASLAWFTLVRSKSRMKKISPYTEATKYLPFNSYLQCPFET